MTKTELVAAMAENAELTKKDSDKVLNAFIAACKAPKFKAGKTLKDAINA